MSRPLLLRCDGRALHPTDEAGAERLRRLKPGAIVRADIVKPRSGPWHRRYWALVDLIFHNQSHYKSVEEIHQMVKLRCGLVKVLVDRHGDVWRIPDSIAFDRMTPDEWADFWELVVDFVVSELIPGLSRADLEAELLSLVGVSPLFAKEPQ